MEATTTLADSLLEDLDDLSDVEGEEETVSDKVVAAKGDGDGVVTTDGGLVTSSSTDEAVAVNTAGAIDNEALQHRSDFEALRGYDEVKDSDSSTNVASRQKRRRVLDELGLKSHLEAVRAARRRAEDSKPDGDTEEEERRLIVESNRHLSALSTEVIRAHGDLCEAYRPKFPELEDLLPNPSQYRAAVGVIRNEMDLTRVNDALNDILSSNQIITVSVAGSTTSGRSLSEDELRSVDDAAAYLDRVRDVQSDLIAFVEAGMEGLAPSVCALVGPSLAARLFGLAGGLAELSRIPACNLQVLGQTRQSGASRGGMGTTQTRPHTGALAACELVARCSSHLRRKALKAVAAKLALAVRCDYVNVEAGRPRSANSGRKFRAEIEAKVLKWEEPDKAQVVKAASKLSTALWFALFVSDCCLKKDQPISCFVQPSNSAQLTLLAVSFSWNFYFRPDLTTKKRRGGKRMRRLKERFEETEMMKQANTRAFLKETGEYGDDSMGMTLGMLDTKEGGKIRQTAEKKRTRQANTKASRKRAIQMSSGATSGLASSMVFTPVQGLELVNPDANKDRVRQANLKWFGENAGFQSAPPKKG
eukprot:CAMPEP_0113583494 /NCGR_PEP_ID=MMETSP0015_2-20120614/32551_1 /TAXON_ID=2838 /ORGANISM="Odontella" /LENGTH=589 /DNA_ID=CAMNT_0000488383 /DNA_START=97 /DNA_END=1867 /DNA_ORIENTATION=+ /assembly_acc=CAM_ASM_000160